MKTIQLISAGSALVCLCALSLPVCAVTVTPPGSSGKSIAFTASGPTVLGKSHIPLACETVLTGEISANGDVNITSVSMRGKGLCSKIEAEFSSQTPYWTGNIENPQSFALDNVAVNVKIPPFGGKCGPTNIKAAISSNPATKETIISFSPQLLSGGCSISGALTTTPYLTITD
jgi:hypothetical protein